jgi:hypothetical protein
MLEEDSQMRRSCSPVGPTLSLTLSMVAVALAGCDFTPQATLTEASPGSGGTSGRVTGTAGTYGGSGTAGSGASGATSGGAGSSATGTGGSMSCGQTNVSIATLPPDILIVQDKSGSMADDPSGNKCSTTGCSKWSQVTTAMENVVMATQANVNWGLKFFANNSSCGINAGAAVPIAANNYSAIQMSFSKTSTGGSTPTETALDSATAYMQTLTDSNPKFLLLATDGLPNCQPGNSSTSADDSPGAEAAVTRAAMAGFPTFVVGIATASDAMATMTLNTMAVNGGYAQTGAATSYYSITDTASLETALNKIVGIVASCTLPLNGAPTNFTNVAVSVQTSSGVIAVPQDTTQTNGWDYINNKTSVQFFGPACDSLKSGAYQNVQFIYACPGTKIIVG